MSPKGIISRTSFELALLTEMKRMKDRAAKANINNVVVEITCEGRVDGDMKITFSVQERYETEVKGDSLDACMDEMLRRKGWHEAHDYLALPNVEG